MIDTVQCYRCDKDIPLGAWASVIVTRKKRHTQYDLCDDCLEEVMRTMDRRSGPKRRKKNG